METITAQEIRDIVGNVISPTINVYRKSKQISEVDELYSNKASDEEIDDFLFSNPFIDLELVKQLTDPGLLGFLNNTARIQGNWKREFIENVNRWATNEIWLHASTVEFINNPFFSSYESAIWLPDSFVPTWLNTSPTYYLIAEKLIKEGKMLSEMHWRDFEKLIGFLLEKEGWIVEVTRGTKDGGIDIISKKIDSIIGEVKTIWQAKKYRPGNHVTLKDVRELSAVRESVHATKGIIVTTTRLTKDAIEWVKEDIYRLGYKEGKQIEEWVLAEKFRL